jgi:cation diffusion facilitator family transporter
VPAVSRKSRSQRAVLLGLVVNISLAAVKLVAGLVGHSYALVADAVESITDIFASVVMWGGVSIGSRPADQNHPYGHGKAEALAAFVVASIIFLAGVGILVKSIDEIITPHHAPAPFTLIVLLVVVGVKELLFRAVLKTSHEIHSDAIKVDAWHHRADAITSVFAGVGIIVALAGGPGWEMADDVAAVLASFVIMYNAWSLVRQPIRELMDEEPPDLLPGARDIASRVPGVMMIEKSWARQAAGEYWIDMHVQVAPDMPVRQAHEIAHQVEHAIRAHNPRIRGVLVHLEPFEGLPEGLTTETRRRGEEPTSGS